MQAGFFLFHDFSINYLPVMMRDVRKWAKDFHSRRGNCALC